MLLELFALHEARDAEINLVAFLVGAFNPNTVCNIDMA
jgi:hypothetical protein